MGEDRRNDLVDFVRGLALLDMMTVHYSPWLDWFSPVSIPRLLNYFDFAVEGFILLSGFVVGSRYLGKFVSDQKTVIKRLLFRTMGIVGIQYVMIFTLSLPIALIVGDQLTKGESVRAFALQSLLFLNQVPLLHILPTFIPLFMLAIPILYLLKAGQDFLLIGLSAGLFLMGLWYPDLGADVWGSAIFPAPLWQTFFVAGALAGKHQRLVRQVLTQHPRMVVGGAGLWLAVMLLVYHGHHISSAWQSVQLEHGWVVKKFPLNALGLSYHAALLFAVIASSAICWGWLQTVPSFTQAVVCLGRNSLPVFVTHVYACFILTYIWGHVVLGAVIIITLNLVGAFMLSALLESKNTGWSGLPAHRA